MANIVKKDLFDTNASLYVLSYIMHNPLILQDDNYAIAKTDFYKPLQEMVYYAVFNMAQEGVQNITPQEVENYIKGYASQYEYYKQNKGYEFVLQCYQAFETSDEALFRRYYDRLKKFALLRDLESIGIDTKKFYDTEASILSREVEDEKLNNTSLAEMLNDIRTELVGIESKHVGRTLNTARSIADGLEDLVQSYIETPEVGLPIPGDIINYAVRGARLGKMYLYSANTGGGKTRFMASIACDLAMPYIDVKTNKVVMRDGYDKVLFVATEMGHDEIQTLVLSHVSGVNEETILLGNYSKDELDRVKRAIQIINVYKDNFKVDCITDPSIALIKQTLTRYIIQDGVSYIFYDYIFTSPGLATEFHAAGLREDVILMMMSNTLKETAMTYDVHITSATQLNETGTKKEVGLRDQNCIRGAKSIADKIDCGMIGVRISEAEWKLVEPIYLEWLKQHPELKEYKPNIVIDIYKNRRGKLNCVKVFRHFDFATCRCVDLFITDASYKAVADIHKLDYNLVSKDYLEFLAENKSKEEKN